MFFRYFDTTPVSRDRDCYSLAKISEFEADAKVLVDTKVLTIFSMAGRYNKTAQCGRESAHKSRAQGEQHYHQTEVGDHQWGM